MQISRSREDRSSGVDHDRQAMRLRALVDRGQPAISVQVVVWRERLVRRVHLDGANSELGKTVDFGPGIPNRSGENSAERDEAVRRRAAVLRAPVVHLGREADNSRSDVVDEPGAFHTKRVQKCEEGFGIGAIALDVRVVPAPLLHQLHRGGDRKSTRLNSSHGYISYAGFCLKTKHTVLAFGSESAALGSFGSSKARAAKVIRLIDLSASRTSTISRIAVPRSSVVRSKSARTR